MWYFSNPPGNGTIFVDAFQVEEGCVRCYNEMAQLVELGFASTLWDGKTAKCCVFPAKHDFIHTMLKISLLSGSSCSLDPAQGEGLHRNQGA